jgi:hypothetical protein
MRKHLFLIFFTGLLALFAFSLLTNTAVDARVCSEYGENCGLWQGKMHICCSPYECKTNEFNHSICCNPEESFGEGATCYCDEECASNYCEFDGSLDMDGVCSAITEDCIDYKGTCGLLYGKVYICCSPYECKTNEFNHSICCNPEESFGEGATCYCDEECASNYCEFDGSLDMDGVCSAITNCGDGVVDEGEECDGSNLNGKDCTDFGFTSGTLKCTNCTFDTSDCITGGNGINGGNGGGISVPFEIDNPLQAESFEELIDNIIGFLFDIAIVLAPLMIIWAAFLFLTSAGSVEQVNQAKRIIFYTAAGFIIILLAKGFITMVKQILGV